MKVYVLTRDYGQEGEHVIGVYASRAEAESQIPAARLKFAAEEFPVTEYEMTLPHEPQVTAEQRRYASNAALDNFLAHPGKLNAQ